MKFLMRGIAAFMLSAVTLPAFAQAADPASAQPLATDRAKASYMVGMDVGASLRRFAAALDMAAFERSFRHSLAGNPPLLDEATMRTTTEALMARAGARQLPPGTAAPEVDGTQAGLAAGIGVGASLAGIRDEIDPDVVMQAVRTVLAGGTPLLAQEQYEQVRAAFQQKVQARAEAEAAALGARNAQEGVAFLAANKAVKGVFTTGSGLQYMVLEAGSGPRPTTADRVRVHYRGTLLDGTEFDSSHARNAPAEFGLDEVIIGWTEAVALMPVGSKYRFWIPGDLAYGEKGTPGGPIGPNATLVFEIELLDIL